MELFLDSFTLKTGWDWPKNNPAFLVDSTIRPLLDSCPPWNDTRLGALLQDACAKTKDKVSAQGPLYTPHFFAPSRSATV